MKYFSLGQQWILFFLALLILSILYFRFYPPLLPSPPEEIYTEVVVEVVGEVRNPGIHIFQNPPTLREAIEKAGGLKEVPLAGTDSLAEFLETGTLLTVIREPLLIDSQTKGSSAKKCTDQVRVKLTRMEARKLLVFAIPLDLNRVSVEDLCLISGIRESLAREIVTYRQKRRGFHSVEELKNVKGIGEKKWKTLKSFFMVRP